MIVIQPILQQTKKGVFICLSQLVVVIFDMILISSFQPHGVSVDQTTLKMTCVIYYVLVCYFYRNGKWFS